MTSDEEPEVLNFDILSRAIELGHDSADIFAAVQEVTIIALNAIPASTKTEHNATQRFLHLATIGMLYEKGMLTERKQ